MIVGIAASAPLAALHAACFPPGDRWDQAAMRSLLAMPGCFAWIHHVDRQPVGLALVRIAVDEAELLTIGMDPAHRAAGHGARMLAAVCAEARRRGAGRLILEVSIGNRPATALYRSSGFVEIGRRARYYPDGSDAAVLAATLPSGEEGRAPPRPAKGQSPF